MSEAPAIVPLASAVDADLEEIAALVNESYRGETGWTTEAAYLTGDRTSAAALRADLVAKPNAILLATRDAGDGRIVGVVWLEPADEAAWYIGMLTARPEAQNRGLGRSILAGAERMLTERGVRTARMTVVNIRDTLIAWYARRGYRATGEILPFPYRDAPFGTPTRDDLAFVVLEKALAS